METHTRIHASTLLLAAVAAIVAGPMALGQTDCQQEYRPLNGYSVVLDPNQIEWAAPDPNGVRKQNLMRVIAVTVGMPATDKIRACDPDADPVVVTWQDGTMAPIPSEPEYYRWTWTPPMIGVTYHWFQAVDVRTETNDPVTTRGTIVVVAVPRNRPPVLCGGQP